MVEFEILRLARPTSMYEFFGESACAEFSFRKVVNADLTLMMKIKVIRHDELTYKTHSFSTLDPTWTQQSPKLSSRITKFFIILT